jgi:flagellar basal-body rod protein FlgC
MSDPLRMVSGIAGAALEAQSERLRVVSENIANARSTGATSGADAYRRKTITFENVFDEVVGAETVRVRGVDTDQSPLPLEHDPGNPAADDKGNVKMPNVNLLVEMADLREATRSYEAGLQIMKQARAMTSQTIDLLRNG